MATDGPPVKKPRKGKLKRAGSAASASSALNLEVRCSLAGSDLAGSDDGGGPTTLPFLDTRCSWVPLSSAPLCPEGHAMDRLEDNPEGYQQNACCDTCGLPNMNLSNLLDHFFHCADCKFDKCSECAAELVRYRVSGATDNVLEVMQDTGAVVSKGSKPKVWRKSSVGWAWRVWHPTPALARHLEAENEAGALGRCIGPHTKATGSRKPVALELGAGSGLAAFILARLRTHDVIITDIRDVLALAREGVHRNFPHTRANRTSPEPVCPVHNDALQELLVQESENIECHSCGQLCVEKALLCSLCDFKLCSTCTRSIHSGDLNSLPRWYKAHCEHPPIPAWFPPSDLSSDSSLNVRALDWTREGDVGELGKEMEAAGFEAPHLVLAADVAYDKSLVKSLLSTLVRIREWRRLRRPNGPPAELLIGHEKRGIPLDSSFFKGLRKQGIQPTKLDSDAVEDEGRGELSIWRAEL